MKKFQYVLWSLLRLISSTLADSVNNFLLQSGILKQAINKNPNTVKMHGKIARWVYADCLDTDVTKELRLILISKTRILDKPLV